MRKKMLLVIRLIALVALAHVVPMASWANSIVNGGFETGDFTGWTLSSGSPGFGVGVCANGTNFLGSNCTANSGNFAAVIGPPNSPVFLSQAVTTVPGAEYNLTFFLRNDNLGQTPDNQFSVSWGGSTLFSVTNAVQSGYTMMTFADLTASGAGTTLKFTLRNNPGGFYLDDISVASIPEPSVLVMLGSGLMALAFLKRRAQ